MDNGKVTFLDVVVGVVDVALHFGDEFVLDGVEVVHGIEFGYLLY